MISQNDDEGERVVSFASRSLSKRESQFSTVEREYLSLIFGLQKFRCYLYGNFFHVIVDHNPLLCLNHATAANPRILRWNMLISDFNFKVFHKPGKELQNADGLSVSTGSHTIPPLTLTTNNRR